MPDERARSGAAIGTFAPPWLRGPASVEDGWIVLDTERARKYQPMAEPPGLLYDLAAVSSPTDVAAFVQRHGLLRHGPDAEEHRERLGDFEGEALSLREILRVYLALQRGLSDDLDKRAGGLRALRGERRGALGGEQAPPEDDLLLAQASEVIARGVSQGLAGVEEAVGWMEAQPGAFVISPKPPDLIGYAYHQLALAIVNRKPVRSCEECGRVFPIHDRRQRFCTPTCASRARYRRWSKRQSEEEE